MHRTGTISAIIITATLAAGGPAFAQQSGTGGTAPAGKVERIYVKASDGLFIETSLVRNTHGRELWADVRLDAPARDSRNNELVLIPADTRVRSGDSVEVTLVDKEEIAITPLPAVSRLVRHSHGNEPVTAGLPPEFTSRDVLNAQPPSPVRAAYRR